MNLISHVTTLLAVTMSLAVSPVLGQSTEQAPAKPEASSTPTFVLMTTSKGDIVLELDAVAAPKTVANFMSYVDKKFYDGTIYHRVMGTFMIQGGGFTADMQKKPTDPPVVNEWENGLKNKRGTISMARLGGNPDSATSQFFINVVDNDFLDRPQSDGAAYAVFGRVVAGMNVVDEIKAVETSTQGRYRNVPVETVIIKRVSRLDPAEAAKRIEQAGAKAAG